MCGRWKECFFTLYALLTFACFAKGSNPLDYAYCFLSIDNGLSNNNVTEIFQDSNGYMWFGTYDGLNRYDGYIFKVFRHQYNDTNSLINNRIVVIREDCHKNIWIGTKAGINIRNKLSPDMSSVKYTPYGSSQPQKLTTGVTCMLEDKQDNMIVGTDGLGILFSRKGSFHLSQIPYLKDGKKVSQYPVRGVVMDQKNQVFVFIKAIGLCKLDYKTKTLLIINTTIRDANCIEADARGNLWIGSNNGLYCYNISLGTFTTYKEEDGQLTSNKVVDLCIDKDHNIWVATDGGGIDILDATGEMYSVIKKQEGSFLTSRSVYSVFEDKEGRIWIGTLRGGIIMLDPNKQSFITVRQNSGENSLVSDYVLSFFEDDNENLWIGTDGGGLSIFNEETKQYTNYSHQLNKPHSLSSNFITSITSDSLNRIWLATWGGGVNRYDAQTDKFVHYHLRGKWEEVKNIFVLYKDHKNSLWAGSVGGGLFKYNPTVDQFVAFDRTVKNVISIYEDGGGQLWVGTFNKLIQVNAQDQNRDRTYEIGRPVRAIYQESPGSLWIGTEGGGLLHFDIAKGDFVRYTTKDGLPSDVVLNILEDDHHNLWMSTYNGLSKFNINTVEFKNFYKEDGLQSNQFNYNAAIELSSGAFLFGGIKGYTKFFPDSIQLHKTSTNVLINRIWVNNTPLYRNDEYVVKRSLNKIQSIEVPYNKAAIRVDFSGINYSLSEDLIYSYQLEGSNNDLWNKIGTNRSVNFTQLEPGSYMLRIKASSNNSLSTGGTKLKITILPPWYESWWAYLCYAIIVISIIYIYISFNNRQTKLKYEIEIAKMNMEKEKEINEKKLNYFTNVTHEFRTPLTLILNPLKDMMKDKDVDSDQSEVRIIYNNARRMLTLVDQLLYFKKLNKNSLALKISHINFYKLCQSIYESFLLMAKSNQIKYEFNCSNRDLWMDCDKEKMETILYNLLNNAFKFSDNGGVVSFSIIDAPEEITINISDTGKGISKETSEKIFEKFYQEVQEKHSSDKVGFGIGLYLVKQLVEKHKGTVTYTSQIGKGTSFILKFPREPHFSTDSSVEQYISLDRQGGPAFTRDERNETRYGIDQIKKVEKAPVLDGADLGERSERQGSERVTIRKVELITTKRSMLVIEDDPVMRAYVIKIFKERFLMYEASDGDIGLQLARQHIPDIIISDVMMSEKNGVEICSIIKRNASLNHIPIILITGSPSDELKLKGIEEGADDYITKPFDNDILIARVDSLIKRRNNLQRYFYNQVTFKRDDLNISEADKSFIDSCIEVVEKFCSEESFNVKKLSKEMGMSHSNLYRKIKDITGQSLSGFVRYIRLRKAAELLITGNGNINQTAFEVGFSDIKYFRKQFKALFGMNPSEYKKKYKGQFSEKYRVNKNIP